MNTLPEPNKEQPHATQAGQPTLDHDQIWNAYDRAILEGRLYTIPTRYKDDTETPRIGPTPPVPPPGRPPMSSKATDDSVRMIAAGFLTLCAGTATAAVLHFSSNADPTVIGAMAAVPAGLAIPVLALSRLVKRVKDTVEAAPPVIHNHYEGTVHQDHRTVNSTTRGLLASTRNQLTDGK